ncbi:hypothetical protein A7U60_g7228 [Sanghuangporus baumii]|uniref:FAM86 N-terminal domain-containing protein n=1 Tax=Sanghuangporus baumii TaxID=108892 RepID=A0A9Q5HTE4_SANBA|nr:hypothetical protein A7U60_g7228 [Sanghuangporus baumii]
MSEDELFFILRAFASLTPIKYLAWPSTTAIEEIQSFLIDHLISSDHFRLYPPSAYYQKSFWKWIISRIEEQDEEVQEEIYSRYLALLDHSPTKVISAAQAPPPSYVTYIWSDTQITAAGAKPELNVENCRKLRVYTVACVGPLGIDGFFAKGILKSSRILELGSGIGFLGIILAQLQLEGIDNSSHINSESRAQPCLCLTDLDEQVLRRCENNVKLPCNNAMAHPELRVTSLDWTDALDESRRNNLVSFFEEFKPDLILGADLVYDVSTISALVATLHLALTIGQTNSSGRRAIIAATRRNEDTLRKFTTGVKDAGLRIEELNSEQNGTSSCFLRNQPDAIGESITCVNLFVITNGTDMD